MVQYATENIRTVALVGHGAAGKTTLAEALLVRAKVIPAPGSVERGTTVSDFDALEKSWQHSLRSSVLHFDIDGTLVHLLDTPGFPDFIGQAIGALDAVETAAIVVNAQAGIEMITSRMMEWAAQRGLCRLVIINKIDAENVDCRQVLAAIQAAFGKECLPNVAWMAPRTCCASAFSASILLTITRRQSLRCAAHSIMREVIISMPACALTTMAAVSTASSAPIA